METSGIGRFVGTMFHIWNPKGKWWGEGDEKFYVDDEKFPSTIGDGILEITLSKIFNSW